MNLLILLLYATLELATSQFTLNSVNNTVGIFYNEKSYLKISNNKWTLLVYDDLEPIRDTLDHNEKILGYLNKMLENNTDQMASFKTEIKTHFSLLKQLADLTRLKYSKAFEDTSRYFIRRKRGLINGIGSIFKSITGNLDASDGEYYTNCINKILKDQSHLENLMKNQISVTTSVIKNFNNTIQKLRIEEETFNNDLIEIKKAIHDISDKYGLIEAKLRVLEICETLTESYTFLQGELSDILNAITFARLNMMHPSIITPKDLVTSLQEISQTLMTDSLPLTISFSNVASYFDIMELSAFQKDSKIVFVLRIPLVEPENYILYRLYPIPIIDQRTGLQHVILANKKYIARDYNSMLYITFSDLDYCKDLSFNTKICEHALPLPIDGSAICEAQLLRNTLELPKICHTTIISATGYNVQEMNPNIWLIVTIEEVPLTVQCSQKEVMSATIKANSILKLQPECSAFIGSTRVRSRPLVNDSKGVTYRTHPVLIPFKCCEDLPSKVYIPDLKPINLNKLDTEELNIAQNKLDQYSEDLDRMMNQPFVSKHISWFTYFTIAVIVILVSMYIFYKYLTRCPNCINITAGPGYSPPPPPPPARKRPSIHLIYPSQEGSSNLEEKEEIDSSSSSS